MGTRIITPNAPGHHRAPCQPSANFEWEASPPQPPSGRATFRGFRVWGLGFGVWGLGFGFRGLGCSESRGRGVAVSGLVLRVFRDPSFRGAGFRG